MVVHAGMSVNRSLLLHHSPFETLLAFVRDFAIIRASLHLVCTGR